MSRESITITDESGRQALVCIAGYGARPWAVACVDTEPDDTKRCKASIFGYTTRTQGIRAAEAHLRWHANGKPECVDCGAWLTRKGAKRCRRGTCEQMAVAA
jgi:hypothetical protein